MKLLWRTSFRFCNHLRIIHCVPCGNGGRGRIQKCGSSHRARCGGSSPGRCPLISPASCDFDIASIWTRRSLRIHPVGRDWRRKEKWRRSPVIYMRWAHPIGGFERTPSCNSSGMMRRRYHRNTGLLWWLRICGHKIVDGSNRRCGDSRVCSHWNQNRALIHLRRLRGC